MRFSTHIAGAAVAAMVAMTAIPNDAAAVPVQAGSAFGFGPVGAVSFDTGSNIVGGIATKTYPAAQVTQDGTLSFLGGIVIGNPVTQGGAAPVTFDVPPSTVLGAVGPFTIEVQGWEFTFTFGALANPITPTGPASAGSLVALYGGTITDAPLGFPESIGQVTALSQSCDQVQLGAPVNCSNTLIVEPGRVPEPASLALLGTALAGLGGFGFFRRRRNAA